MKAFFDKDGFLVSVMRGGSSSMHATQADGQVTVDLPDSADINALFYDTATGKAIAPAARTIAFDRSTIAVGETATIAGLPDPAFLIVNGVRQKVAGGAYRWMPSAPGGVTVMLTGKTTSNAATATADTLAGVEAATIAAIDAEREARQMSVMTTGGAKKYVYNRKADEVKTASGILPSVLNALSLVDKQKKYPFAYAEMQQTGETLTAVLARFETGLNAASAKISVIEAQAQKAKRNVRAATTAAAKQAAANVQWSS